MWAIMEDSKAPDSTWRYKVAIGVLLCIIIGLLIGVLVCSETSKKDSGATSARTTFAPYVAEIIGDDYDYATTEAGDGDEEPTSPKQTTVATTTAKPNLCEFTFNGTCFWSQIGTTKHITFHHADEICHKHGSIAGSIYSPMHYNLTMQYLQTKVIGGYADVALGLQIDPQTKIISAPGGKHEPYVHWYKRLPGYPQGVSGWTRIYVYVVKLGRNVFDLGMLNYSPKGRIHGVLCENNAH